MPVSIGARIKEERQRLGLNQTEFAALAGSSRRAQVKWEGDETAPNGSALAALAQAGADVNYILTGERSSKRPRKADRVLASVGLTVSTDGSSTAASDDDLDSAFGTGPNSGEIREFMSDAKELNIPMSALTRGKALGIIDSYGVPSGDMIQLLQSLALDITMDIIDRRSKD